MQSTSSEVFARLVAHAEGMSQPGKKDDPRTFVPKPCVDFTFRRVPDGERIEVRFFLTTPDAIDNVKKTYRALGWNGEGNPARLPVASLVKTVALTMSEETYNGQTSLRVKWVNPILRASDPISREASDRLFGVESRSNGSAVPEGFDPETGEDLRSMGAV